MNLSFQIVSSFRGCTLPFRWLDYITLHKKIYRIGLFLNLFAKAETCFAFMLDTSKCLLTKYAIQRILYGIKPFFDSKIGVKYETRPLQTGRSAPSECQRAAAFAGGAGNRKKRRSVQRARVCSAELYLPGGRDPAEQKDGLYRLHRYDLPHRFSDPERDR